MDPDSSTITLAWQKNKTDNNTISFNTIWNANKDTPSVGDTLYYKDGHAKNDPHPLRPIAIPLDRFYNDHNNTISASSDIRSSEKQFYKPSLLHPSENFTYESSLHTPLPKKSNKTYLEQAFDEIKKEDPNLIYTGTLPAPPKGKTIEDWEPKEQLLLRSTMEGDEVDRALQKSNGDWTYFASDVAYQYNKLTRRTRNKDNTAFEDLHYDKTILILGVDHIGYVQRMQAMSKCLTKALQKNKDPSNKTSLEIKLQNLVNLSRNGQPLKMSKRAGTFLSIDEVIEEIDPDVLRFTMLTRKNDMLLNFDIEKAKEQSMNNPVFYVQYANARCHSILRKFQDQQQNDNDESKNDNDTSNPDIKLDQIKEEKDLYLISLLSLWPSVLKSSATTLDPSLLTVYLDSLASHFHSIWSSASSNPKLKFIFPDNKDLTAQKIYLVKGTSKVIENALQILGITPVRSM